MSKALPQGAASTLAQLPPTPAPAPFAPFLTHKHTLPAAVFPPASRASGPFCPTTPTPTASATATSRASLRRRYAVSRRRAAVCRPCRCAAYAARAHRAPGCTLPAQLQYETRTARDYRPPAQPLQYQDETERGMAPRPLKAGGAEMAAPRPDTAVMAGPSDSGFQRVTARTLPTTNAVRPLGRSVSAKTSFGVWSCEPRATLPFFHLTLKHTLAWQVRKVRIELPALESETQARMGDTWRRGAIASPSCQPRPRYPGRVSHTVVSLHPGASNSMANAWTEDAGRAGSLSEALQHSRSSAYISNADPSPADKRVRSCSLGAAHALRLDNRRRDAEPHLVLRISFPRKVAYETPPSESTERYRASHTENVKNITAVCDADEGGKRACERGRAALCCSPPFPRLTVVFPPPA